MAAGDARPRGGFSHVRDFSSTTNIHDDGTPSSNYRGRSAPRQAALGDVWQLSERAFQASFQRQS